MLIKRNYYNDFAPITSYYIPQKVSNGTNIHIIKLIEVNYLDFHFAKYYYTRIKLVVKHTMCQTYFA